MEQVEVEKRKFKPKEKSRFKCFKTVMILIFLISYLAVLVSIFCRNALKSLVGNDLRVRPDVVGD